MTTTKLKNSNNMNKYPDTNFDLKTISRGNFEIIELKKGWMENRNILNVMHRHTFHEIVWITSGSDFHSVDFEDYSVSEQQILCIPKGSIHDFKPSENSRGWKLIFDDSYFSSDQLALFIDYQLFIPFSGNKLIDLTKDEISIAEHSIKLIHAIKSRRQQQIVLINFISFLNDCFESNIPHLNSVFFDFLKLLNEKIYERKDVSYYANALNISTKSLNVVVKNVTGKTTLDYIHTRLINEAKSKLLYTQGSIKEIAFSLGFDDALYFSRFFKKRTKNSPEEFRKRASQISII
ncbi:MAG: helix-turn-helix protein [Bacteroidetes bacterium]|nr:helix-turn-helix protein [Bacteroidota bacterium]